jgi:hypothetical protein
MNDLCHFCNTQVETLKHLFYDCTAIQQNWVKFISALKKLYELSLRVSIDLRGIDSINIIISDFTN